jgi:hypothetical protein
MSPEQIPLRVLVCDASDDHASLLLRHLGELAVVQKCERAASISETQRVLRVGAFNTIFIDPLSFDLNEASDLIFSIRKTLPEILFVLYIDLSEVEGVRGEFFKGERSRFNHYYRLDRRTPAVNFKQELEATIRICQIDLSYRLSTTSLEQLRNELSVLQSDQKDDVHLALITKLEDALGKIATPQQSNVEAKTVFVSFSFEETDYIGGIRQLLEQRGLRVITGDRANSSISASIIERIKKSECFLCIMTKDKRKEDGAYTTSPWLLEEKGAALALGKPIVLMVEEGVDEIGGLQGDWQRIHFRPKSFVVAALQAVEQLASYTGLGET